MRRVRKVWPTAIALLLVSSLWTVSPCAQSQPLGLQKIQLSVKGNRRSILFQFSRSPNSVKSFALASPSRLVVDVHGPLKGIPSSAYQADDALLSQIRLGAHPDYLRLVLDLKEAKTPRFTVEQRDDRVVVVFIQETAAGGEAYSQMLYSHTNATAKPAPKRTIALARPASPPPSVPPPSPPPRSIPKSRPAPKPQASPKPIAPPPAPSPSSDQEAKPTLSAQPLLHLQQGQEFYDRGDLDKAIFEWRETVRLAPNNAKAHHLLGLALGDYGDRDEAITVLERSLRLDPHNAMAQVHLARTLEAKGDVQKAVTAYRRALQLVPTSAYIHDRLGHLLAAQGDTQAAANEWQRAIELDPDYAYTHANLGEALESLGRKTKAIAAYERAIELDPQASFASEVKQRIARLRASGS